MGNSLACVPRHRSFLAMVFLEINARLGTKLERLFLYFLDTESHWSQKSHLYTRQNINFLPTINSIFFYVRSYMLHHPFK